MLIVGGLSFLAKAIMHPAGRRRSSGTCRTATGSSPLHRSRGGFLVGLTSVGQWDALRPRHADRLPPLSAKIIVGTDIFHAAALLWVAGLGHLVAGNVDMGAIGWLLVGSIRVSSS